MIKIIANLVINVMAGKSVHPSQYHYLASVLRDAASMVQAGELFMTSAKTVIEEALNQCA